MTLSRLAAPALLCLAIAAVLPGTAHAQEPISTHAERSGFLETGRYPEVIELCDAFAARHADTVRCIDFGTTPQGRPMKALVVSQSGAFTPEQAREQGLPVTLVQGGIHAGEIDGKDAGFLALRQLLEGEVSPGVLQMQVFVFVPVFNVDGHERFKAWNRPNQRGPKEMGWRTTAQNLNLNRDYLKAEAPEMQAMLGLMEAWDPLVYVDLHATNGAQFEHDISIQVEPVNSGDPGLREAGLALRDGTIAALEEAGSLPLPFYPSFVQHDNPASGFEDGVSPPRFSHGYMPYRNRFGMLVETHSWKEYPQRVQATRNTIVAVLDLVAANGARWLGLAREADARAARIGGNPVELDYAASDECRRVDFRGYEYTRTPSEVSGGIMTRYDETSPETWNVPLCDDLVASLVVDAPKAGYLVPAEQAGRVAAKLDLHGVQYQRLEQPLSRAKVEAFRADEATLAARSMEGLQRITLEGDWEAETHDLVAGALFVPVAQARSRMAMALLEPEAPDSLAAWGWFNNAFERKEYMEAYVAEQVAREMLDDRRVKAEFERRLRADEEFAASTQARLDWFYQRHDAWDDRLNLYPVLRTDRAPR